MNSQTLISILIWVAVLCSTHVVSATMTSSQKLELANKLNMLVYHSGWRSMDDIKISMKYRNEITDPISDILKAISLNQLPVDESNVLERHNQILTVLLCKYSEIIYNYKILIHNLIRACQNEKSTSDSFLRYYDCFRLLLIKLHSMSPWFKCMMDALNFIYTLVPSMKPKYKGTSVMDATQKLSDYTSTIGPKTSSKLSEHGINVEMVDHEINSIGEYISDVYKNKIYLFTFRNCNVSKNEKLTKHTLLDNFVLAKNNQLIPLDSCMLQYVIDKIDSYGNDVLGKWFNDLGFTYGVEGKIIIKTN